MGSRVEQKLLLEYHGYPLFFNWLKRHQATLAYPSRIIKSIYFDNLSMQMYSDTVEGIVPRSKIRIRAYGNKLSRISANYSLEFKTTTESGRIKESQVCPEWKKMIAQGICTLSYGHCMPVVEVMYHRSYFNVLDTRITIDRNLRYRSLRPEGKGRKVFFDGRIALEVKANDGVCLDFLANEFPFPKMAFSKYANAFSALYKVT